MPVNEKVMAPGTFSVPMLVDAPRNLLLDTAEFGHIVITDQWLEPELIGDAGMLAAARYSGVVLSVRYDSGRARIEGQGMAWWLGSSSGDIGPILETKIALTTSTLSNALDNILPSAITKGTVNEPDSADTFTGEFQWTTPMEALRTVSAALGTEWKVNPDGTLDAGEDSDLFDVTNPSTVVVRDSWGSDPTYRGVPSDSILSEHKAEKYATKVLLLDDDLDGTYTSVGSDTRSTTYKDIHGNAFTRTVRVTDTTANTAEITTWLASELEEWIVEDVLSIDASSSHSSAAFSVGDAFWVYDPPVVIDVANSINYRGDIIHPVKLRLLEASWPVTDGMGVYYRDKDGAYLDLTRWVAWERSS